MEHKIRWYSGCYDEIELVSGKANENCGMLKRGNKPITREMFFKLSEQNK